MIKCTNCERLFENERDLSLIIERRELVDGEWHATDRFVYQGSVPEDTETVRYEAFKGCPECLGDEYLMDLDD